MLANEASVHDKFLDTIHKRDGRYEVSLPWKEHHPFMAVARLQNKTRQVSSAEGASR